MGPSNGPPEKKVEATILEAHRRMNKGRRMSKTFSGRFAGRLVRCLLAPIVRHPVVGIRRRLRQLSRASG